MIYADRLDISILFDDVVTAFSYTMTAEEIVRVKQLRRREKSKSYSQKYRDVNAKGTLVWPAYAAEQGAEQGQCQALPVAGLG